VAAAPPTPGQEPYGGREATKEQCRLINVMPGTVLIVGGIGYLGYNLASEHASSGDIVYVAARRGSAERRPQLFSELRGLVRKTVLLGDLGDKVSIRSSIDGIGCPDIAYLATGRISGSRDEMLRAHVEIPLQWARILAQRCRSTLIVYISAVFAAGDPGQCARDGTVYEEEEHLWGCKQFSAYAETKAEGERRIIELCRESGANVAVLRPGLLVGEWSYHREWRLLYRLARLHLRLSGGPYIHVTPAKDIARAARLLLAKNRGCQWYYATPWRLRLGELHARLSEKLGTRHVLPLYTPAGLASLAITLRELGIQQKYVIVPRRLSSLGMRWTGIDEALGEMAQWMKRAWGGKTPATSRHRQVVVIV